MHQVLTDQQNTIEEIAKAFFLSILFKKLNHQQQLFQALNTALTDYYKQINKKPTIGLIKFIQETESFKAAVAKIITVGNDTQKAESFDQDFAPFLQSLNEYIESLPVSEIEIQSLERFKSGPKESWILKIGKAWKKVFFNISQWPIAVGNIFRKLLKKPPKPSKQWTHKIPLQNLASFYHREMFSVELLPLFQLVEQKISIGWESTWRIDEEIDRWALQLILKLDSKPLETKSFAYNDYLEQIKELINAIERLKEDLQLQVQEIVQKTNLQFEDAYVKAGTIELPAYRFGPSKIKKKHQVLNNSYKKIRNGWFNTFFALFDGWKLDRELYDLIYISTKNFHSTKQRLEEKLVIKILPEIETLHQFLSEIKGSVEQFSGDKKTLKTFLAQKKKASYKQLNGILIPQCLEAIFSQNLAREIDNLETVIQENTHQLSDKRTIVRTNDFDRIIKGPELDSISPLNLIAFETLPNYINVSAQVKSELVKGLQDIQIQIRELAQITDFNLGAALSSLDGLKSIDEESQQIASEGLGRAIVKVEEVDQSLNKLLTAVLDQIWPALLAFNDKVFELTETENAFNLKIRVAKAKAIERSKNLKKQAVSTLRNFIPLAILHLKNYSHKAIQYYNKIIKKYGITSGPQVLSVEFSDFLARAQEAIQKLPYVYQKLFEIAPLEEETFYEKRLEETESLEIAYKSWQQGNYSTVLLIGETGAGATTLLNFFLKEINTKMEVIRPIPSNRIHAPKEMLAFLNHLFNAGELSDLNELINFIKKQEEKKVIILENLQRFFIRKIDGFLCLKMIFELIVKTRQDIFWIATINHYTYSYLNKTKSISDHFAFNIKMAELSVDQIISIILKRHGVSGYKLEYLSASEDNESKKFQRLNNDGKQQYLKAAYFSRLNKLAGSNIGLALVYWLRSTSEVVGDKINIISLKDLDFSFLSSLTGRKVFSIHSILLHGGLTLEEHTAIFNQPASESELMLMTLLEDGIIIKNNDVFKVNPLLYRPIVNWLKSKNLIH